MLVGVVVIAGATAIPASETACGLLPALSVKVNVAAFEPVEVGENVTFTVVVLPAVMVIGRLADVNENSEAFAPDKPIALITRSAVPLFVTTRPCALLLVPTFWFPNDIDDAELKPGAVPVPVSATVCGLPVTLSVIDRVAVLDPIAAGVNVTAMVVVLPAVTVIGSVPAVKLKSEAFVPLITMLEIVRSAVPVFVTTRFVGVLLVVTN
jgi:hypothetical protein